MKFSNQKQIILFLNITALIFAGSLIVYSQTFKEPSSSNPNNTSLIAPLNTGKITQKKAGGLWLNYDGDPSIPDSPNGLRIFGGANSGRVGIGIVNPREKLDLLGDLLIDGVIILDETVSGPNHLPIPGKILGMDITGGVMEWQDRYAWLSLTTPNTSQIGSCGDLICQGFPGGGENCQNCPSDCACQGGEFCNQLGMCVPKTAGICGDNICGLGEDCSNCAQDCGVCQGTCSLGSECSDAGSFCSPVTVISQCGAGSTVAQIAQRICVGCQCVVIPPPAPVSCSGPIIPPPCQGSANGNACGGSCPSPTQVCTGVSGSCDCIDAKQLCGGTKLPHGSGSLCDPNGICPPGLTCDDLLCKCVV